jgi:hypothetical protein
MLKQSARSATRLSQNAKRRPKPPLLSWPNNATPAAILLASLLKQFKKHSTE